MGADELYHCCIQDTPRQGNYQFFFSDISVYSADSREESLYGVGELFLDVGGSAVVSIAAIFLAQLIVICAIRFCRNMRDVFKRTLKMIHVTMFILIKRALEIYILSAELLDKFLMAHLRCVIFQGHPERIASHQVLIVIFGKIDGIALFFEPQETGDE